MKVPMTLIIEQERQRRQQAEQSQRIQIEAPRPPMNSPRPRMEAPRPGMEAPRPNGTPVKRSMDLDIIAPAGSDQDADRGVTIISIFGDELDTE